MNSKLILIVFVVVLLMKSDDASQLASSTCENKYTVDVSNGVLTYNGTIIKDDVSYPYSISETANGCICNATKCVRKCCPWGEYMSNKKCIVSTRLFRLPKYSKVKLNNSTTHIIVGNVCPKEKTRILMPSSSEPSDIFVEEDGSLNVFGDVYTLNDYCIDFIDTVLEISALVCVSYPDETFTSSNTTGMIISLPCLFITFLVYFLDPNRNFHGMCLMCYVSTLFCAYVFLIILQLHSDFEMSVCTALGILCYFFFLVSFFWLNIMCIHMWRIGGQQNFSRSKKANRNRFLAYSAYAWGVPLIMTGIVVALRFSFPEESNWLPSIGIRQCWFNDDLQSLIYFYGPVTVLITINITLFAITAIKILKAKKDTAILRKDEKERKTLLQRFLHRGPIKRSIQVEGFNLYSKLVLAMGVNWAMEVISFYFRFVDHMSPKWIWYFTDFCNACYGVFIFFVYAFKKVWTICKVRYYKMTGKPYEEKTVTQSTPRTVTSNVSYATSNNAESTAMIS
ncbi:G-protein coupled receptor Mth isoform X3 [Agrilus planipennis]|uniref:G-protein coupled receptor Mth isoform X3 n=1 Tax=Agrilus planipennis TaxID=224129 RepID=A0A1W4X4E4_AGRPL|nr:G-protein coupled receptor Mth isoform X3 [Agrilus planipennis]